MTPTSTLDARPMVVLDVNDLITRIHAVHTRRPWHWMTDTAPHGAPTPDQCGQCHKDWPCATIIAITP